MINNMLTIDVKEVIEDEYFINPCYITTHSPDTDSFLVNTKIGKFEIARTSSDT